MDEEQIAKLLDHIGALIELKAKRLCPVDMGALRASIRHRVEGNKVIIWTDIEYAQDMEYGRPPEPLDAGEKESLKDWAKRHSLPAYAVIRKIETKGIEAGTTEKPIKTAGGTFRPFMRPALFQSMTDIKSLIKSELS